MNCTLKYYNTSGIKASYPLSPSLSFLFLKFIPSTSPHVFRSMTSAFKPFARCAPTFKILVLILYNNNMIIDVIY